MQSEAGVTACMQIRGAGTLTIHFYSIPGSVTYDPEPVQVAGERLPGVFSVSARCVATQV